MIARGKYYLSQFDSMAESCTLDLRLEARRPSGSPPCSLTAKGEGRPGHGSATSPQTQPTYKASVHTKISCLIGDSGTHGNATMEALVNRVSLSLSRVEAAEAAPEAAAAEGESGNSSGYEEEDDDDYDFEPGRPLSACTDLK